MQRTTHTTTPDGRELPKNRTRQHFRMASATEAQEYMRTLPCPALTGEKVYVQWDENLLGFSIWSEVPPVAAEKPTEPPVDTVRRDELMAMKGPDLLDYAPKVGIVDGKKRLEKGKAYLVDAILAAEAKK